MTRREDHRTNTTAAAEAHAAAQDNPDDDREYAWPDGLTISPHVAELVERTGRMAEQLRQERARE